MGGVGIAMFVRALVIVALAFVMFASSELQVGAQDTVASPSVLTIGVLILLSVLATLLIAVRFKWIEFSLKSTSALARMDSSAPKISQARSTAELSSDLFIRVEEGFARLEMQLEALNKVFKESKDEYAKLATEVSSAMKEIRSQRDELNEALKSIRMNKKELLSKD